MDNGNMIQHGFLMHVLKQVHGCTMSKYENCRRRLVTIIIKGHFLNVLNLCRRSRVVGIPGTVCAVVEKAHLDAEYANTLSPAVA
jgi:hypothetical protein